MVRLAVVLSFKASLLWPLAGLIFWHYLACIHVRAIPDGVLLSCEVDGCCETYDSPMRKVVGAETVGEG